VNQRLFEISSDWNVFTCMPMLIKRESGDSVA